MWHTMVSPRLIKFVVVRGMPAHTDRYTLLRADLRVMVLERGKLMEYAPPLELLNDPNSLFYALCKKTGALEQLKETARFV